MRSSKYLVTDKKFYKEAVAIAIPISLQSMITMGVNLLDNIMVGSLGETVMSATALANQYVNIFHICCMGIGMGASVLTARFFGMKDDLNLKRALTIMLRFCFGLSLLFTVPAILTPGTLMRVYTPDQTIIMEGLKYYRFIWPCLILQGLSLTCTLVLRTTGQVQLPLYTSIGAFFVNVFFNYILIFGKLGAPRLEIMGAAIGTLLARVFEFLVICGYLFFIDQKIGYRFRDLFMKCDSLMKEYITISIPVFVSDTLLAFGNSMVAVIMGHIGKEFVSANAITTVTQQLSTVLIQGISHAGCIMTGHTLGRGETEKAITQAWTFYIGGFVFGAIGGIIILLLADPVIAMYRITDTTKAVARELMYSIALIVMFQATNSIMMKGVLRGGGDTRFLMVADIFFLWVLSIPLGALAGLYFHMSSFWIYFFLKIEHVIKAIWSGIRLKSGQWIKVIDGR
ncbi:MAG: MATE family efflux transporter [Lachnospiraceae bacterium]|nr:MATE family efflux transporter [Lachnospiraceae bacterium]